MGTWIPYRNNPKGRDVGDCVIRAISKVTGMSWYEVYDELSQRARDMADRGPDADLVWGSLLHDLGYVRRAAPDLCPACYTVFDFMQEHPEGTYFVCPKEHVAAVIDGDLYDSWDSRNKPVYFFWEKRSGF